ncbi:probable multidrug resistance-associated protein lethal(2)03659 isoform X2 [Belonocnema kinseyi]|uniref:probable multidrug resistance-associated protein lethal(2)03659 isoform X2 n=1 Tax=Belonocnema kinseyi TaxID=2817044 RepID=UPI00143D955A|nr:probable multidrug resistance-associated protein lethal(2)03659 isoform X2 [Belonocnema kinseyi]
MQKNSILLSNSEKPTHKNYKSVPSKEAENIGHLTAPNPRQGACFFSIITFAWFWKIFCIGYQREIKESDLFKPLDDQCSEFLSNKIQKLWHEEVQSKAKDKARPSLFKVLIKCFGLKILIIGFFFLISEAYIRICEPLFMGKILSYFKEKSETTFQEAFYWAAYSKVLQTSKTSLETITSGQILNLLSNDLTGFPFAFKYIHYLWITFVLVPLLTFMIYREIGWPAFSGVTFFCIVLLFQGVLGKFTPYWIFKAFSKTDERLRLIREIVSGSQVIKMLSWEEPFLHPVDQVRRKEMRAVWKIIFIETIATSFQYCSVQVSIFTTIIFYFMFTKYIIAEKLFVVIAYFYGLRIIINNYFVVALQSGVKAYASIKRLENFLESHERAYTNIDKSTNFENTTSIGSKFSDSKEAIFMEHVTTKWSAESKEDTLKSLNMSAKCGNITAVIGQVASGKSSLLHLILHELPLVSGKIKIHGEISYFSQDPWTFGSSIRENIIFGRSMNKERYDQVIKVCQLERDFSIFPYKDQTIIGEKGINLSGGQRARVALARTVYADVDIYLFDDPLSAVDAEVGRLIFEQCICNFLKGKTRILVTHQLQYLRNVDYIYFLNGGSVEHKGTFQDLQNSGLEIVKLLQRDTIDENGIEHLYQNSSSENINSGSVTSEIKETQADEVRAVGNVSNKVYLSYFKAVENNWIVFLAVSLGLVKQVAISGGDYLTSKWINNGEACLKNDTDIARHQCLDATVNYDWYFYACGGLLFFAIVVVYLQIFYFLKMCTRASLRMHSSMMQNIIYARVVFFYQNPVGRIMNRFSKDMAMVDTFLPPILYRVWQQMYLMVVIIPLSAFINYWLLLPLFVIGIVAFCLTKVYLRTSRSVKRLSSITRSPMIRHLDYTLQGLTTIRAFKAQHLLSKEFNDHQDQNTSAFFLSLSSVQTFVFYLDIVFTIYTASVIYTFLFFGNQNSFGDVGLIITQNTILLISLKVGTIFGAEMENCMTSTERILEYTEIERENMKKYNSEDKLLDKWPVKGKVEFKNLSLRYSPEGNPVLKNLNFVVNSEKIGIVGRTGAGKTSLISALFRLVYLEGEIYIDDIPTFTLDLKKLRSKISIIPQEPLLFDGTIRKNLDPLGIYSDGDLWQALKEVEFKNTMTTDMDKGLESTISDGGRNLSKGQRQLLCLARAIVRQNKILILDEPTADVDQQTDQIIQETIRKRFCKCTIFIIAHRLITVMDCDRIMVMNEGSIVEFDNPFLLLENKNGYLSKMVQQTGTQMARSLAQIAENRYRRRQYD